MRIKSHPVKKRMQFIESTCARKFLGAQMKGGNPVLYYLEDETSGPKSVMIVVTPEQIPDAALGFFYNPDFIQPLGTILGEEPLFLFEDLQA